MVNLSKAINSFLNLFKKDKVFNNSPFGSLYLNHKEQKVPNFYFSFISFLTLSIIGGNTSPI
jgi:hypothetical protein